jgi:glucose/arabinose dehydrogenase
VADEYSTKFNKDRNIIKIKDDSSEGWIGHFGGSLAFDKLGKLYLSVGDATKDKENQAQNLKFLKGKILRLDVSKLKPEPEIVAYGLRNPWKMSIDSKNRMFIGDVGKDTFESVYLITDLYSGIPYNLGWPVFEGTL